jgi:hypothetical protein
LALVMVGWGVWGVAAYTIAETGVAEGDLPPVGRYMAG